jgi:tetratricopeptide (TPR) repeat protein
MKFIFNILLSSFICSYSFGQTLVFPDVVEKFITMTEIQQKDYEKFVVNKLISGRGKIQNVEECGFTSQSKSFGKKCYEVILDKGVPRVVLYFSLEEKSRVIQLRKGEQLDFSNCQIITIKNLGFWSTVYCDTNFVKQKQVEQKINNPIINEISPAKIASKFNIPIKVATSLIKQIGNSADMVELGEQIDLNGDGILDYIFSETLCGNMIGCFYIGIISRSSDFISIDLGREITIKKGIGKNLPVIEDNNGTSKQWSINSFKVINVKESPISVNCDKKQLIYKGVGEYFLLGKLRDRDKGNVIPGTEYTILTSKGELLNGSRASLYDLVIGNLINNCPGILNQNKSDSVNNNNRIENQNPNKSSDAIRIFENEDFNLLIASAFSGDSGKIESIFGKYKMQPQPERGDRPVARKLNSQGLVAFNGGNFSSAASFFQQGVKADQSDPELINNYAYALLKNGQYKESVAALEKTLVIAVDRSAAWFNLYDLLAQQNADSSAVCGSLVLGLKFAKNPSNSIAYIEDQLSKETDANLANSKRQALACAKSKR